MREEKILALLEKNVISTGRMRHQCATGTKHPRLKVSSIKLHDCNEHDTIYVISSDFGDRMTTQSMRLMVLLREHF